LSSKILDKDTMGGSIRRFDLDKMMHCPEQLIA